MLGLTKIALKRPVSICMAVIALFIFGTSTIFTTPMETMPDIEMPMLFIWSTYPGAAPQDVEDQVTSVLEDACSTLSGVKTVQSMSMENVAALQLMFEYGTNMDQAHNDLNKNLDMYKSQLPDDAEDPVVIEMNINMMPIITLSATATGDVDLKYYVEDEIVPEIEKIGGVASVDVSGGQSKYIKINLREDKLKQYHLSMKSIADVVGAADFSMPAGSISQGSLDMTLRGGVEYDTLQSLRDMPLSLSSGDTIRLEDVADVYYANKDRESLSYYNGLENVTISVSKRQSASTIAATRAVTKVVDRINASNIGVHINVIEDSSDTIISSIISVAETMLLGIVLAMLVLFIFLGDWRASLIVGSSIPLSLLVTMIAMSMMGFSYNILSLGGLVIGVGMMVDNSIVVIESCFRLKGRTDSFYDAAIEGTKAVNSSIAAGTLTTVVVFLPMALIKGLSGQLFGQLCFTIVFSLIASLISAITIVPLVFFKLKPVENEPKLMMRFMDGLSTKYANFLPTTFKHKKTVVAISVLMLAASIAMIPLIGVELIPASDDGVIKLELSVRPGTNLDTLKEYLAPIEEIVKNHPDVDRYSMTAGTSGMGMIMGNDSDASVTAYLKKDRKSSTDDTIKLWREQIGFPLKYDVSISSSSQTVSMSTGTDIQIALEGSDYDDVQDVAIKISDLMRASPYLMHIDSPVSAGNPQAEVIVDPVKASAHGTTPQAVMGTLYATMEGSKACDISQGGRDYEVRVEYPNDRFETVSDLASLNITNSSGEQIPLLEIADIKYSNSPLTIMRDDGSYYVSITAQPTADAPVKLTDTLKAQITDEIDFPTTVSYAQTSDDESIKEEFTALLQAIATAILLVFFVMAMQFESAVFSGVVMVSMPFAMIGSFLCMLICRCTISMTSLMGFLMLTGTVVNNGILLIDTTNALRIDSGLSAEDALLTAGMLRMRPIFMTTLTTVLAMVPMAIGIGSNAAMMRGMAMVIIGGLVASTALTLLLIPTFYLLTDKEERKRRKQEKAEKKAAKKQLAKGAEG